MDMKDTLVDIYTVGLIVLMSVIVSNLLLLFILFPRYTPEGKKSASLSVASPFADTEDKENETSLLLAEEGGTGLAGVTSSSIKQLLFNDFEVRQIIPTKRAHEYIINVSRKNYLGHAVWVVNEETQETVLLQAYNFPQLICDFSLEAEYLLTEDAVGVLETFGCEGQGYKMLVFPFLRHGMDNTPVVSATYARGYEGLSVSPSDSPYPYSFRILYDVECPFETVPDAPVPQTTMIGVELKFDTVTRMMYFSKPVSVLCGPSSYVGDWSVPGITNVRYEQGSVVFTMPDSTSGRINLDELSKAGLRVENNLWLSEAKGLSFSHHILKK